MAGILEFSVMLVTNILVIASISIGIQGFRKNEAYKQAHPWQFKYLVGLLILHLVAVIGSIIMIAKGSGIQLPQTVKLPSLIRKTV